MRDTLQRRSKTSCIALASMRWVAQLLILFAGISIGQYVTLVFVVNFDERRVNENSLSYPKTESVSNGMNPMRNNITNSENDSVNGSNHPRVKNSSDPTTHNETPGVIVLGMHRSGTSLLSGLLVKGLAYTSPGLQIRPSRENPLGFFENVNVMRQNDRWLQEQGMSWDRLYLRTIRNNLYGAFDSSLACTTPSSCNVQKDKMYYYNLDQALASYDDPKHVPWLLKDPRLCLMLEPWLNVLKGSPPAVLLTFRDPLEVAQSLQKRNGYELIHGITLWIWYNRLAIENSKDLCRVVTSNQAVSSDPVSEINRIGEELRTKCGVPSKQTLNTRAIQRFFRSDLLHYNSTTSNNMTASENNCSVAVHELFHPNATVREHKTYQKARKMYCDMHSGEAFFENYSWPALV